MKARKAAAPRVRTARSRPRIRVQLDKGRAKKKAANQPEAPARRDEADIQLVNRILLEAFENTAADIHFEWVAGKLRVRLRVDGVLRESAVKIPPAMQMPVISRLKIMAGLNEKETRVSQDGRCKLNVKGKDYDLRVSAVPYATGESE